MAKGYSSLRGRHPIKQKTGLLNKHIVHGDDLDNPQIQKPDLSSEFSSCLQKY